MPAFEISDNKLYAIPANLSIHDIGGTILVICPDSARWIVLQNANQLEILRQLKLHTVSNLLQSNVYSANDIIDAVIQLEAKRFCSHKTACTPYAQNELHFYITNKCNLRCPQCYMSSGLQNPNELSLSEISIFLKHFKNSGGTSVTFSGGEPTIRTDFIEILSIAKELSLETRVITNGVLWNKEYCDRVCHLISSVQVSIDGFSPHCDSLIRGDGHFNKALSAVSYLLEKGIPVVVAVTPTLNLLKTHKTDYIRWGENLLERWKEYPFEIRFSEGLLKGRNCELMEHDTLTYKQIVQGIKRKLLGDNYEFDFFVQQIRDEATFNNCSIGNLTLTSTGDVYFCPNIFEFQSQFNIRNHSYDKIYAAANRISNRISLFNRYPCKDCDIRNICGGQCIIDCCEVSTRKEFYTMEDANTIHIDCPQSYRNMIYDYMIKSNSLLFQAPEE